MKSVDELCMEYLAKKPSYYNAEAEDAFKAGYRARDAEVQGLKIHGNTYCEHCESFVILCSHGMGIDYKVLADELQAKLQAQAAKAEKLVEEIDDAIGVTCKEVNKAWRDDGSIGHTDVFAAGVNFIQCRVSKALKAWRSDG